MSRQRFEPRPSVPESSTLTNRPPGTNSKTDKTNLQPLNNGVMKARPRHPRTTIQMHMPVRWQVPACGRNDWAGVVLWSATRHTGQPHLTCLLAWTVHQPASPAAATNSKLRACSLHNLNWTPVPNTCGSVHTGSPRTELVFTNWNSEAGVCKLWISSVQLMCGEQTFTRKNNN